MMDFKGIWRTRSGKIAEVKEFLLAVQFGGDPFWEGKIGDEDFCWSMDGNGITEDYDLVERLSARWNKERSGGE